MTKQGKNNINFNEDLAWFPNKCLSGYQQQGDPIWTESGSKYTKMRQIRDFFRSDFSTLWCLDLSHAHLCQSEQHLAQI